MSRYRVKGRIGLEASGDSAEYELVMDWPSEMGLPTATDVLQYMVESGEIQIISETIEEEEGAGS